MYRFSSCLSLMRCAGKSWVALSLAAVLLLLSADLFGQSGDPPTFSSVAKWTLNDLLIRLIQPVDSSTSGRGIWEY